MENPPILQLICASVFASAGIALGMVYDVGRAVRRVGGKKAERWADTLFVLLSSGVLFYLAMAAGNGQLRIFMVLSALGGALVYHRLCSGFVVPVLTAALGRSAAVVKKLSQLGKKFFPNERFWYRIVGYSILRKFRRSGRIPTGEGADVAENPGAHGCGSDGSAGGIRRVEYH